MISQLLNLDVCAVLFVMQITSPLVDAWRVGGLARFINHSARPNLIAVYVAYRPEHLEVPRLIFFANQSILPGQELTFVYNESLADHEAGPDSARSGLDTHGPMLDKTPACKQMAFNCCCVDCAKSSIQSAVLDPAQVGASMALEGRPPLQG